MQVDVVSLRDIKMKVDDTIVIELQLSDAPDRELTDIIEAWPRPSHHTLAVDHSVLILTVTGGAQNAVTSMQWLLAGREGEGPPLVAMAQRYERLLDVREARFAHLDNMLRNRPV